MNRNTIIGLIALVGIAAGTLFWRYRTYQNRLERQQEITAILENTEDRLYERVTELQDLLLKYPDDETIRRVALYQIVRAHAELKSDAVKLTRAAERFLEVDSSGAAFNYVSSVYADRAINVAQGLRYANRALIKAQEMERPKRMTEDQWAAQRRMMIGECEHIRGKLYALNAQPRAALSSLRAARDSVPDSPDILLDMAKVYERASEPDSALSVYMDVVRLRYRDPDARQAIRRLYPQVRDRYASADAVLDTLVRHARRVRKEKILAERIADPAPKVPALTLPGIGGSKFNLQDMGGKTLVLYFWATWCQPCRRQIPLLDSAYAVYGSRPDVAFLAVSLDERPEAIPPFIERTGFSLPVALGDRSVYSAFDIRGLPTLIIVDKKGMIRFHTLGHSEVGDFVEELGWQIDAG